jgi:hypothetical protein
MSYVHCPACATSFDARRAARCPRCGEFLGARAPLAEQVTACVDRLGALLAGASEAERAAVRAGLLATPPCADREATRYTNAVGSAVAGVLAPPTPAVVTPPLPEDSRRLLALGFWLGVASTLRTMAGERYRAARRPRT